MRLRVLALVVGALVLGTIVSCSQPKSPDAAFRASASSSPAGGGSQAYQSEEAAKIANSPADTASEIPQARATVQLAAFEQTQADRFLIKNGTLTLEVKDARAASTELTNSIKGSRGYLSDMQETVDSLGVRSITVQVRIPANGFDGAIRDIETLGKVMDRHVGAEDVTEEFVDSQSRLRNLKRTEDRLLAHLGRTGKLSDTLLVEREITRVRQEIEQLEGRVRFLSNRISYSTIGVTLQEAARATSPVPPRSFSSGQIASEASRSLVGFLQYIWSIVIWLAVWSPVLAPIALLTWFAIRQLRHESSTAPAS